nr:hypothetical protein 10 - Synechococcus sp. (PCC 6716) [Synechococcus sp.]CAA49886.1 unnamed protein product [Synechococcus sp.]
MAGILPLGNSMSMTGPITWVIKPTLVRSAVVTMDSAYCLGKFIFCNWRSLQAIICERKGSHMRADDQT